MQKAISASILVVALSILAAQSQAAPWIDVGDEELRHHLQVLSDAGIITVPITTYPLMWSGISQGISSVGTDLSEAELWSLAYVRHELRRHTRGYTLKTRASAATDVPIMRSFASEARESAEGYAAVNWLGEHMSVNVALSASDTTLDDQRYRFDGSYIAGVIGNWSLSYGVVDRWWGPGWQNSLILSNNARPVPGFTFQRNYSDPFNSRWLSWIGPWQFTAFAGQLETDRTVKDAKLVGARLSIKPAKNLEIAFSRTAQWGGDGRPETLDSLADLALGKDNRGQDGVNESNEPGNQLAGVDVRYSRPLKKVQLAVYGQAIGEDAAGIEPSRRIYLVGTEAAWGKKNVQHRIHLEASYTEASQGDFPNYAYEHGIYRSGYRYRGRALGAALDNDTRTIVLVGDHYFDSGNQLSWQLASVELNRDNANRPFPGGNTISDEAVDFTRAEVRYKYSLNRHIKVSAGAFYSSEDISLRGTQKEIGSGLLVAIERKW